MLVLRNDSTFSELIEGICTPLNEQWVLVRPFPVHTWSLLQVRHEEHLRTISFPSTHVRLGLYISSVDKPENYPHGG